jgi:broad specificity phosphatase PhoE
MTMHQRPCPFDVLYLGRHPDYEGAARVRKALKKGKKKVRFSPDRFEPLTKLGRRQGFSTGVELASLPAGKRPTLGVSSHAVRTIQGLDEICLGGSFKSMARDKHYGFRDARRGRRSRYVSTRAYFKDHPRESAERHAEGKLFFHIKHGEADIEMMEGRVVGALRDVEETYGRKHKVVFLSLHHTSLRAVLAIYLGLEEDEYEALCKEDVPNGSYCVLVRDKATGLLSLQEKYHIPKLMKVKEYRRLRKERKEELEEGAA